MTKLEQAEQELFDMDDHPPHRLCECRKCMEYFTPLPDCDAFAGGSKPIVEQTNTQLMEGYRIGLAEMREKCAKVAAGYDATPWKHCQTSTHAADMVSASIAAAIRAINFEGDTGFRPVSEMVAEHKQDPKKAEAIEKAKMRKAEQEPVGWLDECGVFRSAEDWDLSGVEGAIPLHTGLQTSQKPVGVIKLWESETGFQNADYEFYRLPIGTHKLYAAPVRTKDLTDDEIHKAFYSKNTGLINSIRAVIAAYKEKNKC